MGGGYGDDPLADLPLAWIQQKARAAGLALIPFTPSADQALTTATRDSFAEFLGGTYQWLAKRFKPGDGRHIRKYDTDPAKPPGREHHRGPVRVDPVGPGSHLPPANPDQQRPNTQHPKPKPR